MKNQIRFLALKGARLTACVSLAAALCMSLSACCMRHEYSASTCALPGVCAKCGKVSEEPLPDHQWAEADCTTPKTCKVCGKTEGEALGHSFGEWKTADENAIGAPQVRVCSVCGEEETQTAPRTKQKGVTVLTDSGLSVSVKSFAQYLLGYLPDTVHITDLDADGFIVQGRLEFGDGMFISAETVWSINLVTDKSAHYKDRIVVMSEDKESAKRILPYLLEALAPSIGGSARKSAETALSNAFNNSVGGVYFGKADLGSCMCTMTYVPQSSSYPMLTFATKKFVNG